MRAPAFWWRRPGLASALLSPIGAVVGAIALARMGKAGGQVDAPVLCIGNPTVGGAGKTPTAIALLQRLTARGATPFALLRGHGGAARMPLRVDTAIHGTDAVGDEALLLARHAATIVAGGARRAGAGMAVAAGASHVVMDDGFQNPSLHKDVSVLVVDGKVGVGNSCVTPAGPLRAPLLPQLARADAVLVVGDGSAGDDMAAEAARAGCTVLRGRLVPDPAAVAALRGVPLIAFAGIGRPEKFFATLESEELVLHARHAFADHHPFRPTEIARLAEAARAQGARLVTTEKDRIRLAGPAFAGPDFAGVLDAIATLPVTLALDDPGALDTLADLAEARFQARRA